MLAIQLKNWLESVPDDANILVFVYKIGEERQLLMQDIDVNRDGNVVIDAEYDVPPKRTVITPEVIRGK